MHRRRFLDGLLATASVTGLTRRIGGSGPAGRMGDHLPLRTGAPGSLPAADRDQGMGATDAAGYVIHFPLRATGARQYWVNTATGSDGFNGLSPYPGHQMNGSGPDHQIGATGPGAANGAFGPKSSYAQALNTFSPSHDIGEGHQFFFAEGQTFIIDATRYGLLWYRGRGATYPACFQSYDPRDPLNIAKHGRAGTGSQGARPIWKLGTATWPSNIRGTAVDYGGWVFRGLEWLSPGNGQASGWVYCQNNLLFEGMVFNNVALTLQNSNLNPGFTTSSNNIIRLCASYGQHDSGGAHICGVYSQSTNLTVEDCIFWHCGWKVGVSRDMPPTQGGPDMFKHCLYLHNGLGTTSLVRRCVLIDGSASGLSLRGNHLCHHNVIIDCPTPEAKSGGTGSDTESPNGVSQRAYCQLVIGGADISSTQPRMWGFSCSDGTPDSYYAYSLYANCPGYGQVNNQWLAVGNLVAAQVTHMGFYYNRAYGFAPPAKRLVQGAAPGGTLRAIQITDTSNLSSPSSPMTNTQIYAAIGYPGKSAMIRAMIADPTRPWAYRLLAAAAKGFNFNFNHSAI